MDIKQLKINEQSIVFDVASAAGTAALDFYVLSGSRMLMTLVVSALSSGAQVTAICEDAISVDDPYQIVEQLDVTTVGQFKRVFSDFNKRLRVRYVVTGGTATFKIAVAVFDNASTTRIENASLSVDLNHVADANGKFDSLRVGDGVETLAINPDGSINIGGVVNIDTSGLATEAEQQAQTAELQGINTGVADVETVIAATNSALADANAALDLIQSDTNAISDQLPDTIGPKLAAGSLSVVLATDALPLPVSDADALAALTALDGSVQAVETAVQQVDTSVQAVETAILNQTTELSENIRSKVLKAVDRAETEAYTPVGNNYRLDSITYTSPGLALTVRKNFTWLDFGTKNERLASATWEVV